MSARPGEHRIFTIKRNSMKKRLYTLAVSAVAFLGANAQGQPDTEWQIAGDKITTEWAAQVDPSAPLPEYPRPQMVRENWLNLNGLRSEEHTSELQSLMRISYAVFCLKKKINKT